MRATWLAVVLMLVSACGKGSASGSADPWSGDARPAERGATIGGGNECPMPITLDIPGKWKPTAILSGSAGFSGIGMNLSCEIDGKPAGVLGFVRVWTGRTAEPRTILENYVHAQKDSSEIEYRDTKIGESAAVEAVWRVADSGRKRAFAFSTPHLAVLVTAGGVDDEEYQGVLPAYLLVKQTMAPATG